MQKLEQRSKNVVYACLLGFIGTSLMVLSQTYSSMIFITNFANHEIPYLYVSSGLATVVLMQLMKNYMNRSPDKFGFTTHIGFILLFIPFVQLLSYEALWIPFVFSTLLLILVGFTTATYIVFQMRAFTLREYKSIGKYLSSSSTLGAVVWGPLIPFLIKVAPTIILLYTVIILLILAMIIMILFKAETHAKTPTTTPSTSTRNLFKNHLFFSLFICGILVQIIQTSADFAPKSLLSSYSQVQIGNILGPFYSIANVVAIISQLFLASPIIKRYGIFGILLSLPITVIPIGIVLFFFPYLWVSLIFSGIALSSRFGFYALGTQMVLNVFPDSVINMARYQMSSISRNLGIGIAGIVLIILNNLGGLRLAAAGTVVACIYLIHYFLISEKKYKQSLIESINLHRFNLDYLNSIETDRYIISHNAEEALKSNQVDVQLFGLELFSHIHHKIVPKPLYALLSSDSEHVKITTLRVIESIPDPSSWKTLLDYFKKEKNPEIIFRMIKIILKNDYAHLLPFAVKNIDSNTPQLQGGAIMIFLKGGDIDQVIHALNRLKQLAANSNPDSRAAACDVLGSTTSGDFSKMLMQLLQDENEKVLSSAIKAAKQYKNEAVIDALLNNLRFKSLYHKISRTLLSYGPEIIDQIIVKIKDEKQIPFIITMIKIVSLMPEKSAENELISLLKHPNNRLQNPVAKSIAYRAITIPFDSADKAVINTRLQETIFLIQTLTYLESIEHDGHIKKELSSRILQARRRYLHMIVALCENKVILQLIPTLMYSEKKSSVYSKALELLDINITNRNLVTTIEYALENKKMRGFSTNDNLELLSDPWINELILYKSGQLRRERMEIINRILVLREVSLFQKLPAEALESIAETVIPVDLPADHVIFNEGDMPNGLYIIAKGKVKIIKNGTLLREYHENEFFGELSLMDDEPRTGTAITTTDCALYLLEKSDFNRLTDDAPEILKSIVQTIMSYLRPYLHQI